MSDDSKNLSRVEDLLNNDPYLPKTPMSRVEKLLEDGILPKVTPADNGKILKVKDGEWETGEDISGDKLPPVSSADNGKVLKVVDSEWNIGEDEGDRLPFVTGADEGKVLKVNDQGHWEAEEEDPELPATTSADAGKILKVDSNGDWSKGDETVELPSVSSSDNGKILKVNNGAWSAGDETKELPSATSSDKDKVLKVGSNGNWEKATDTAADTVSQMNTAQDKDLPILFSYTQEVATKTEEAAINKDLKYNPGRRALTIGDRADGSTVGTDSVSLGTANTASMDHSYAEGYQVTARGSKSHAEGAGSTASGDVSHAEGNNTTASGDASHAEGGSNTASGDYSHAEGGSTTASGLTSHAEGSQATASGDVSHAEGNITTASGDYSHAEGFKTTASGITAHAEGSLAVASGNISHAEGLHTIAQRKSQHVFGAYNISDTTGADGSVKGNYIEIVGNGTADNDRSNARTLDWNGNETLSGKLTVGAGPTNDMDAATKQYVDAHSGLPEVTTADEGKILEVNSSGEWAKGDAPESIQVGNANGDIVSFNDGAENILMPKLTVDIQPKQNLHGYNNPWVGGAGKNKLPLNVSRIKSFNTTGTWSGNAYTLNGVTFTILTDSDDNVIGIKVNGTSTGDSAIGFDIERMSNPTTGNYILNGCPENGGSDTYYMKGTSGSTNIYDTGEGKAFNVAGNNLIVTIFVKSASNQIFQPMLRLSTESDDTFEPYENDCPISGWSACNVVRSGENIWDEEWELGIYNTSTGEKQADNSKIRSKNYISVKPSNSYRIVIPSSAYCRYFCYDINKNLIITEVNQGSVEITTPNNCYFMTFNMGQEYRTTYNNDISINYPSTDTEYHAYNGNTYTINFVDGSSPLIVYGSTLDVLSGLLTVNRWYKSFAWGDASSSATFTNTERRIYELPSTNYNVYPPSSDKPQICDKVPYEAHWSNDYPHFYCNERQIVIFMPIETSSSKQIAVSGELQTKVVYQLTPTEVKSLLENNVIYADAGKVTVTYYKHSEALEDMDILFSKLPNVNTTDNNKALLVKNGEWTKAELPEAQDLFVAKTQQQYDDLPSSKYTDNILYFITDGEIEGLIPTVLTEAQYEELTTQQKNDPTKLYFVGGTHICYKGVTYYEQPYIALTQAQYDALPSSKLTDGKMYYITDQDGNELPAVTTSDNGKVLKVVGGAWTKDCALDDMDDMVVGRDSWGNDIVQRVITIDTTDYPNGITSNDGEFLLFTVNTSSNAEVLNCEIVRAVGLQTVIDNVWTVSDPSKDPRVGLVVVARWISSGVLGFYALVTQPNVTVHPTLPHGFDPNIQVGSIIVQYSLLPTT